MCDGVGIGQFQMLMPLRAMDAFSEVERLGRGKTQQPRLTQPNANMNLPCICCLVLYFANVTNLRRQWPFRSAPRTSSADCSRDWTLRCCPLAQPRLQVILGLPYGRPRCLPRFAPLHRYNRASDGPTFLPSAQAPLARERCANVFYAAWSSKQTHPGRVSRGKEASENQWTCPCRATSAILLSIVHFASYMEHDELITNKSKH